MTVIEKSIITSIMNYSIIENVRLRMAKFNIFGQNKNPDKRALFRLELNGSVYRFGTVSSKESKSLIVKLDSFQVIDMIRPSFEILGISAEDAFKALPDNQDRNEKLHKKFKRYYRKISL